MPDGHRWHWHLCRRWSVCRWSSILHLIQIDSIPAVSSLPSSRGLFSAYLLCKDHQRRHLITVNAESNQLLDPAEGIPGVDLRLVVSRASLEAQNSLDAIEFLAGVASADTEEAAHIIITRLLDDGNIAAGAIYALSLSAYRCGESRLANRLISFLVGLDAQNVNYLTLQARVLSQQGRLAESLIKCEQGLSLDPTNLNLLELLGIITAETIGLDAAEEIALKAISIDKNSASTLRLCAHILGRSGKPNQARSLAEQAIRIDSDSALAHFLAGSLAMQQEDNQAAELRLKEALSLQPKLGMAMYNLAVVLQRLDRHDEAHSYLQKKIQLSDGKLTELDRLLLGSHWLAVGNLDRAESVFIEVLKLNPHSASGHGMLGLTYQLGQQLEKAVTSYLLAVFHSPTSADSQLNLGLTLLLLGDYKSGWGHYEWRRIALRSDPPSLDKRHELETDTPASSDLIITSEQGLGDIIQFMRYAPYFRKKGVRVHLFTQEKLLSLTRLSGLFDTVSADLLPLTQALTDYQWIPILSIPRVLNVTRDAPLYTDQYLSIPTERILEWQQKLKTDNNAIVGIHWQGNPDAEKTTFRGRSLPLSLLSPLFEAIPNANWISLQKGFGSEQLTSFSHREQLHKAQDLIDATWDFVETGAIMENCDLIITSDSAVAHLAGALGRPVWLLLTLVPDWRWGLEGETTSWYPSMRLFRQREFGNWNDVIQRVSEELALFLRKRDQAVKQSKPTLEATSELAGFTNN